MIKKHSKIAIIGLGYVGLPLAKEFSKIFKVIGYDTNIKKIKKLNKIKNKNLFFTNNQNILRTPKIFIVCVPTPINKNKTPELSPLKNATKTISKFLKSGDIVIFESTVYPGLTEEICVPILEKNSKMKLNKDFYIGYSPERVSPGDKSDFTKINKVISGSNTKSRKIVFELYKKIIKAKLFPAKSIKVAEASKILENVQRDINISLMNEMSLIFSKLKINTNDVLNAAKTKWNFLNFTPGLVGGHCISVDPYYLTYKAKKLNYNPKVILSGRTINDKMGIYVGKKIIKKIEKKYKNKKINLGIFGLTFKENTNDTRDSKVFDIINILKKKKTINIFTYDPNLTKSDLKNKNIKLNKTSKKFDVLVLAVPHKEFKFNNFETMKRRLNKNGILVDIKGILKNKKIKKNFDYWSL